MKFFLRTLIICSSTMLLVTSAENCRAQTSAQRVAFGLSKPLYGTFAPGDTDRMFLVEQGLDDAAQIKVLDLNSSTVLATPFLTITGMDTSDPEEGLLGLAFDPDYANNGYFYINGTFQGAQTRIRRYSVLGDPATSNTADASSAFEIMSFAQPGANHNGGWIGFDPTSANPYLYIATGDGGGGGADPNNNAQNIVNERLGKMLRIDISGDDFPADAGANYAIPPSNPFVNETGDDEIWAYGLRNPWRNSFDRETGDLWIADVGQREIEEVNFQPADSPGGENYGWRVKEGLNCFDNSQAGGNPPCDFEGFTDPVYTYTHEPGDFGGQSVTGGYVYRGSVAQYEGHYFFADYVSANIWTIDPYAENIQLSAIRRNPELPPNIGNYNLISSFAEDANGELYIFSYLGRVFRIESTARDAVWNGDDATAGMAGDGTSWSDANNWTRDGVVDTAMVASDRVIFAAGSSNPSVDLEGDRSVGGAVFQADYTLGGGTLNVLSGNLYVDSGVSARINGNLAAQDDDNSIRKWGNGTLIVNAGAAQVALIEGRLSGGGSVGIINAYSGTTIAPGDGIGQLDANDVEMREASSLEIEIGDAQTFDRLVVSGPATIDGSLVVDGGPYTPSDRGDSEVFTFLLAADIEGEFDEGLYNGTQLDLMDENTHTDNGLFVGYLQSDLQASVYLYYALEGDANGDGFVDGIDFIVWNKNKFTEGTDWTMGDFNGDGLTDGLDFILWNENKFTEVQLPGLPAVPEPGTSALIASLLLLGGDCRRRWAQNVFHSKHRPNRGSITAGVREPA